MCVEMADNEQPQKTAQDLIQGVDDLLDDDPVFDVNDFVGKVMKIIDDEKQSGLNAFTRSLVHANIQSQLTMMPAELKRKAIREVVDLVRQKQFSNLMASTRKMEDSMCVTVCHMEDVVTYIDNKGGIQEDDATINARIAEFKLAARRLHGIFLGDGDVHLQDDLFSTTLWLAGSRGAWLQYHDAREQQVHDQQEFFDMRNDSFVRMLEKGLVTTHATSTPKDRSKRTLAAFCALCEPFIGYDGDNSCYADDFVSLGGPHKIPERTTDKYIDKVLDGETKRFERLGDYAGRVACATHFGILEQIVAQSFRGADQRRQWEEFQEEYIQLDPPPYPPPPGKRLSDLADGQHNAGLRTYAFVVEEFGGRIASEYRALCYRIATNDHNRGKLTADKKTPRLGSLPSFNPSAPFNSFQQYKDMSPRAMIREAWRREDAHLIREQIAFANGQKQPRRAAPPPKMTREEAFNMTEDDRFHMARAYVRRVVYMAVVRSWFPRSLLFFHLFNTLDAGAADGVELNRFVRARTKFPLGKAEEKIQEDDVIASAVAAHARREVLSAASGFLPKLVDSVCRIFQEAEAKPDDTRVRLVRLIARSKDSGIRPDDVEYLIQSKLAEEQEEAEGKKKRTGKKKEGKKKWEFKTGLTKIAKTRTRIALRGIKRASAKNKYKLLGALGAAVLMYCGPTKVYAITNNVVAAVPYLSGAVRAIGQVFLVGTPYVDGALQTYAVAPARAAVDAMQPTTWQERVMKNVVHAISPYAGLSDEQAFVVTNSAMMMLSKQSSVSASAHKAMPDLPSQDDDPQFLTIGSSSTRADAFKGSGEELRTLVNNSGTGENILTLALQLEKIVEQGEDAMQELERVLDNAATSSARSNASACTIVMQHDALSDVKIVTPTAQSAQYANDEANILDTVVSNLYYGDMDAIASVLRSRKSRMYTDARLRVLERERNTDAIEWDESDTGDESDDGSLQREMQALGVRTKQTVGSSAAALPSSSRPTDWQLDSVAMAMRFANM